MFLRTEREDWEYNFFEKIKKRRRGLRDRVMLTAKRESDQMAEVTYRARKDQRSKDLEQRERERERQWGLFKVFY